MNEDTPSDFAIGFLHIDDILCYMSAVLLPAPLAI